MKNFELPLPTIESLSSIKFASSQISKEVRKNGANKSAESSGDDVEDDKDEYEMPKMVRMSSETSCIKHRYAVSGRNKAYEKEDLKDEVDNYEKDMEAMLEKSLELIPGQPENKQITQ